MTYFYRDHETKLVKVNGPLLGRQADEVATLFRTLFEAGGRRLVVDLADVPFIDSRGLATLVDGYRLFGSQPHHFRLAALQSQPQLVLNLTGFDHIFQHFETVTEAVANELATAQASSWNTTRAVSELAALPVNYLGGYSDF